MLGKVASGGTLGKPVRVTRLIGDVSEYLAVDAGLTNGKLCNLALDSRGPRAGDIEFATIPVQGTDRVGDQSIVRGDRQQSREMFDWITRGDFQAWLGDHTVDQLPARGKVK